MPFRIQRKRSRNWRKPPHARIVDRTTKFGNPYAVGDAGVPDRATAVSLYEHDLLTGTLRGYKRLDLLITAEMIRAELRGLDLCFPCELNGEPCHADILLKVANL